MNSKNDQKDNSMLYISFNQDNSFFSIGTEQGFVIYKSYPLSEPYKRNLEGGIGVVEMVNNSNFLLLIGGGKIPKFGKNTLIIWDDYENKVISELKFTTSIKLCKYKKNYLFVICQKKIYTFDFDTYENIDTIDTGDNAKELIAINTSPELTLLAYPSSEGKNKISLKNIETKEEIKSLKMQEDSVSKISINNKGNLIATANENGTLIRIHNIHGDLLQEFKRGHEKAIIYTICFDKDSKFMAVSSSRGTIHIFSMGSSLKKLKELEKNKNEDNNNNKSNKKKKKDYNKKKKKDENKTDDSDKEKEEIKEKENENIINDNNEKKIINEEKKEIIEEKEINEIKEETTEEELPENSKTFLGGIFGSKTEKSFAKIKIESQESICAFVDNNKLVIVSSDNKYELVDIDLKNLGEYKIIDKKDLIWSK